MLSDILKDIIEKNHDFVELFQQSILNGVASVMFSEYISRFKQRQIPTKKILVPDIRTVRDYTDHNTTFMTYLGKNILKLIRENYYYKKYEENPFLSLLKSDEEIDILMSIYIIPNISRVIPAIISKKMGFDQEQPNQIIQVNRDIRLFTDIGIDTDELYDHLLSTIVSQTMMMLVSSMPGIKRRVANVESNKDIIFPYIEDSIIRIDNSSAISSIFYSKESFSYYDYFKKLFDFVTSSYFKEGIETSLTMSTGPLNAVILVAIE